MRRVLVARLDGLGGVLLSGPAIRAVARHGRVTLLCSTHGTPAARMLPGVAEVIVWNSPWAGSQPRPVVRRDFEHLERSLRSADFDEAVILTSEGESPLPLALVLKLAGVPRVTGESADEAGSLLDVRLRPGDDLADDQPEAERALAIAAAAGYPPASGEDPRPAVTPPPDPARWVGHDRYVVVHPGAPHAWPAARHAELVHRLAEAGHRLVVTGGPTETGLTAMVSGPAGLDLGGCLTLPEFAGVLAGAGVVVVGNTGPAHLAAAVGTPVVSLFAPVGPAVRWLPQGVPSVVLGDPSAECRDAGAPECPMVGTSCLAGVTVSDVLAAVGRLLPPTDAVPRVPALAGDAP